MNEVSPRQLSLELRGVVANKVSWYLGLRIVKMILCYPPPTKVG